MNEAHSLTVLALLDHVINGTKPQNRRRNTEWLGLGWK